MDSPARIIVVCDSCGAKLAAPLERAGKPAKCKCGKRLLVPEQATQSPPAVKAVEKPLLEPIPEAKVLELDDEPRPRRTVTVECPNCSSELEVRKSDIGRKIDCPRCDQRIRVPEPIRARKTTKKSRGIPLWAFIVGGVLLLALTVWGAFEIIARSGPSVPVVVVLPGDTVKLNSFDSLHANESTLCVVLIKDSPLLELEFTGKPRLKWSTGDITEVSQGTETTLSGGKKVRLELIFRAPEKGARPRWLLLGETKTRCRSLSIKEFEDEIR